ncbi:MAG: hypothetical protein ACP5VE_04395 [Chthonomonadales bacterium]
MRTARWVMTLVGIGALAASTFGAVWAQGRGRMGGFGPGAGRGACLRAGNGMAFAGGGWWTRVTPRTAEEKALVARVTELHNALRSARADLWAMQARKAPAKEIAAQQQKILNLQAELQSVTQKNEALIRGMGIPAPYGVCDGTGPKGPRGGRGMGPRNGTGPNPYCPFRSQ